jgi:hypothetical protein
MKKYEVRVLGVMLLLGGCGFLATSNLAQEDELPNQVDANRRLLPSIGPGLRAVRLGADGRTYVLASPSPGLVVFDKQSKPMITIGPPASPAKDIRLPITFGEDCDVDAKGNIYVADRGANLVQMFSPEGALLRSIAINAPVSVAALPDGEIAVSTLHEPKLVVVFDKSGHVVREFGDPEQVSDREDLNRFLNIGKLATDPQGHLYYGFEYMPEPTVRQYDRAGYAGQDVQYTAVDAYPDAQAIRREIVRQEKRTKAPTFKRVLTAVGIDPATDEVWMGIGNNLLRFDKEGNRRDTYQLYTPDGARLGIDTILVTQDHVLIGNDPLGIYEFNRPDKKTAP